MRAFLCAAVLLFAPALAQEPPFAVAPGLFDFSRPGDLGLKPAPQLRTSTVFRAGEGSDHYANGAVAIAFKGKLYVQWQSSAQDEDAPDTHVVYAVSNDGRHWSAPKPLTASGIGMSTSGGWWSDGKTLVAYTNAWSHGIREGGATVAFSTTNGEHWDIAGPVIGADKLPVPGVIEQDPHALPDGRIVTAFHLRPGLLATPFYTDDPLGLTGWTKGKMTNLPHDGSESRELEPSWFRRADGCLVMVFRDQQSSFRQLASESCDRGESWSVPVLTQMPDSRAKQSAGNLSDGTAFLVNAPSGNKLRAPLVVTLSRDGRRFDRAFLLASGPPPPVRYPGKYKRPGYHYPKTTLFGGEICTAYTSAKEDVLLNCFQIR